MRKSLLILAAMVVTSNVILAQVHIQATLPTVGLIQKNQLWNLVLVNGTTTAIDGRLDFVLRDRQDGKELFTAATRSFSLPKGSSSLNVNSLNPIQYNYINMQPDKSISGLLPAGAYIACYSFTRASGAKQELIAEECISFDIEPLSPPMLLFPADSSELDIAPTQFTWTPPTPAGMFNKLQYEVVVTEIRPGQKPTEAVQDNMSFYNTGQLANNFLTYPASSPAFEKEKWYAWQVIARDGDNYAAKTETWVFKIKIPVTPEVIPETSAYLLMQDDVMGTYKITSDKIRIKYVSPDPESEVPVIFYDDKGNVVKEAKQKLRQGDNYMEFNLNRSFREGIVFKVTITDSGNRPHTLTFSITKN